MVEGSDTSRLLLKAFGSSELLPERVNLTTRSQFQGLLGTGSTPTLINEDISTYRALIPKKSNWLIRSMSVAPISLDGDIIGCLNQGDVTADRFSPELDPVLLAQLALKFSLCLSNVTAHEKLRLLAFNDPLTELLNRRSMEHALKQEFNRAIRYNRELSVSFIDLDKFKLVNDQYGHDAGDKVLMDVAKILSRYTRESDILCRFAGDEFVLVLPETPVSQAESMMLRIQEEMASTPIAINSHTLYQQISYGIASLQVEKSHSYPSLLKHADKALYRNKKRTA
ncbi:GGDEF domain-containing protein [Desulfoluna sp.]|uniref:GGDEF domain-containing protein n=1 Tax=Desulfoluna sp. TaxID=2045199 RepID=UPI0026322CE8|nr:GGDEF domain-containing protein [Desulfoluna sp.]